MCRCSTKGIPPTAPELMTCKLSAWFQAVTVAFFLRSSHLIFHFPVCCSVGNSVSTSLGSPSGSRGLLRTAATLILVKWCMWSLQAQQGDEKSISCSDCFVSYMDLVTWSIGHILNLQISLCLHNTRPKIFKWKFQPPI